MINPKFFALRYGAISLGIYGLAQQSNSKKCKIQSIAESEISNSQSDIYKKKEKTDDFKRIFSSVKKDPKIQSLKENWKSLAPNREEEISKIEKEYEGLGGKRGFTEGFGRFSAKGLSVLASYIKEKKGLSELYVSGADEDALYKIEEVLQKKEDKKFAIVLASSGHKRALLLEKKDHTLHVVYMIDGFAFMDYCHDKRFSDITLEIDKVCKNKQYTPRYYVSGVLRLHSLVGCGIFALEDSIAFLEDGAFFERIQTVSEAKKEVVQGLSGITEISRSVQKITQLPPAFMIGTQSIKTLESYKNEYCYNVLVSQLSQKQFQEYPGIFLKYLYQSSVQQEMLPNKKKNLQEYQNENCFRSSSLEGSPQGALRNFYIDKKTLRYNRIVLELLKTCPPKEIEKIVDASLLSTRKSKSLLGFDFLTRFSSR